MTYTYYNDYMENFDNYKKTIDISLSNDKDLNYLYTGDVMSSIKQTKSLKSNLTKNYSMSFIQKTFEEITCFELQNKKPNETLQLIKDDLPIDIDVFRTINSSICYSITSLNENTKLRYKSGILLNYFYSYKNIAQLPYIEDKKNIQTYYCVDRPIQSFMYIIQNMTYTINNNYHTITYPLYKCDFNLYKIEVMNLKEHREKRLNTIF